MKINQQINYLLYRQSAINFIKRHLNHPVSIQNILETDSLDLYTNAETYKKLLSNAGEKGKEQQILQVSNDEVYQSKEIA